MPFRPDVLAKMPADLVLTSDRIVTCVEFPEGGWVQMDVTPEMLRAIRAGECRVWLVTAPHAAYDLASGLYEVRGRKKGQGA